MKRIFRMVGTWFAVPPLYDGPCPSCRAMRRRQGDPVRHRGQHVIASPLDACNERLTR